jgi:hypothetical protein
MDQPIRVPRNLTALLQHLQRLVVAGHVYWTADRIPVGKLAGFVAKWDGRYRLRADAPARAYRRRTGRASVHLALDPALGATDWPAPTDVGWWMLSTAGLDGLGAVGPNPGQVRDARTVEGRLRVRDYELLEQPKTFRDGSGKTKTLTTWTWRIAPGRYREWEALLVERARQRDRAGVDKALAFLSAMPLFAGVRAQVIRLAAEANKVLKKVSSAPVELPPLPAMGMVKLWDEDRAGI